MTKKLSDAQRRMLEDLRDHGNLYHRVRGRSQSGGAIRTVMVLRREGYINEDWHMMPAGLHALDAVEDEESGHDPRTPQYGVAP